MEQKHKNNLLLFILATLALVAILFSVANFKSNLAIYEQSKRVESIKNILDTTPILAKAISVYDITLNQKLYGKNDSLAFPLASLAKTMAIIVVLNSHEEATTVVISPEAVKQAGDYGLFAYEKWNRGDLIRFTLVGSSNDGAYALAEEDADFLSKMNTKARKIGMDHTQFLNFTGLDITPTSPGAVASAEDANVMAVYAFRYRPDIFSITTKPELNFTSLSGFEHNIKNTNIILDKIPNLLFSKTGYTDFAGGNLTIIFKDRRGEDIAVTLMGSTFEGRFTDMENIVNVLYNL